VAAAVPGCECIPAPTPLSGLWAVGQADFDAAVVSLTAGRSILPAIRSLRQLAPQATIVVVCPPQLEPDARQALQAGAHEYLLEPLRPEELAAILLSTRTRLAAPSESKLAAAGPPAARAEAIEPVPAVTAGAGQPARRSARLTDPAVFELLAHLGEGLQATLDRLAALLRAEFGSENAAVRISEVTAFSGSPGPPALEQRIRRENRVIGSIELGPPMTGTYTSQDADRLAEFARLAEILIAKERQQLEQQELIWRDDLSGLHNRRYFDAKLDEWIEQARARYLWLTVVLFDIDNFKSYNDAYGHETGDALIREVAELLRLCQRETDVLARYGLGDEFAVILRHPDTPAGPQPTTNRRTPRSQHPTDFMVLAGRYLSVIRSHPFKCLGPDAPGPVTMSGGLACYPWDGTTRSEVMRAADQALRAAKRSGKNRIVLAGSHPTR